ncbi:MAG: right-handed parallel beta-helix repeat-containing protein [Verrucomicrobia bacterium]|nr:right-handed parallel beta-helix repeat-containing protein [Verrucomicrobiota bacterium]
MKTKLISSTLLAAGLLLAAASSLHAQATRTWVSGTGDDANPCSRTAPCKTFASALSKTAAGGEINCIDNGGFGAVTITKSITIDGTPTLAAVLASGSNGIVINAGPNDVVTLRGLDINGLDLPGNTQPLGLSGIRFLTGKELHVENCTVYGFSVCGIDFEPQAAGSLLFVNNCTVRDNPAGGILVKGNLNGSPVASNASLEKVRLERNSFGLRVEDSGKVTVHDSVATGNASNGVLVFTASIAAEANLDNCVLTNNGTNGAKSQNPTSTVRLSNCTITDNNTGLSSAGGAIISFGNNRIAGNAPGGDGAPTQTVSEQ